MNLCNNFDLSRALHSYDIYTLFLSKMYKYSDFTNSVVTYDSENFDPKLIDSLFEFQYKLKGEGISEYLLEYPWELLYIRYVNNSIQVRYVFNQKKGEGNFLFYLDRIKSVVPSLSEDGNTVIMNFWYRMNSGGYEVPRKIMVPCWKDICDNYEETTQFKLNQLLNADISNSNNLILFHGNPGTGKTYAIRAMVMEWRDKYNFHYIMDPEEFLGMGSYMMQVLLNTDNPLDKATFIVLEDSGELLTKGAKNTVGQGLSRLLNITDGLIGQGLKITILITTNEKLEAFHPAIIRRGRCTAEIGFLEFSYNDAKKWLNDEIIKNQSYTLADLYELKNNNNSIRSFRDKSSQKLGF